MDTDPVDDELAALVDRTRGAQPWRKLLHAANGVAIAAALTYLPLSRRAAVTILLGVLAALVLLDLARLARPRLNELFFTAFSALASPREASGVASSTWYTLGVLLAVGLFPRHDAVSGVLVLGLADPAASWVGRRWGRTPFMGGTTLGTLTFSAVALGVLALRHPPTAALLTALAVTVVERLSWPLGDNLTVPVASAAALAGLGLLG